MACGGGIVVPRAGWHALTYAVSNLLCSSLSSLEESWPCHGSDASFDACIDCWHGTRGFTSRQKVLQALCMVPQYSVRFIALRSRRVLYAADISLPGLSFQSLACKNNFELLRMYGSCHTLHNPIHAYLEPATICTSLFTLAANGGFNHLEPWPGLVFSPIYSLSSR